MALTAGKLIEPDGAVVGGKQKTKSSTLGVANLIDKLLTTVQTMAGSLNFASGKGISFDGGDVLSDYEEFGTFDKYIWGFVNGEPIVNLRKTMSEVPATTKESDELSKDLKKRGFKFVGSTIMYAHMQACGLVNDHTVNCFRYKEVINKV